MGYNYSSEEVLGVGSYRLKLCIGRTLLLEDVRYAPIVRLNLLSVVALLDNGYVIYDEHPNSGKTGINSRDVDFIGSDFHSIGDVGKNLDLYELEEVEVTLPSPNDDAELISHPIFPEDSINDTHPGGSIPDSGSTPPGPSVQLPYTCYAAFEMQNTDKIFFTLIKKRVFQVTKHRTRSPNTHIKHLLKIVAGIIQLALMAQAVN
ncbi:hypothetical protein RJ640_022630 [Escallonia rubra]|uniref:Retrovirus-related Pol polyprotein from transposon TNT 1-94-like beta-barrel domain-containing protein n=1 Tax=Escallonia rubra TaxID=112253 RepID=A0AA88QXC3_9ASTE|nr:hypothetical protein RJ640_022630 [Escallonia rubra]